MKCIAIYPSNSILLIFFVSLSIYLPNQTYGYSVGIFRSVLLWAVIFHWIWFLQHTNEKNCLRTRIYPQRKGNITYRRRGKQIGQYNLSIHPSIHPSLQLQR